uniref:Uncharacterized protein n=1 Tax=Physcomitrium patens TaxID=3218 RepID=A0A2K1JHK5_PHYPA|nr:hypothetical protein PHYPA_018179 [Physcomitrium patens]
MKHLSCNGGFYWTRASVGSWWSFAQGKGRVQFEWREGKPNLQTQVAEDNSFLIEWRLVDNNKEIENSTDNFTPSDVLL